MFHLHCTHQHSSSTITVIVRRILLLTTVLILLAGLQTRPSTLMMVAVEARTSLPPVINIGAIFEAGDEQLRAALLGAVEQVNQDAILLPKTKLNLTAFTVEPRDSFNGAKLGKQKVWVSFFLYFLCNHFFSSLCKSAVFCRTTSGRSSAPAPSS